MAEKAAQNIALSRERKLADSYLKGYMKYMMMLERHSMPGLVRRGHSAVDNERQMLGLGPGSEGHFLEVGCMAALDNLQVTTRVVAAKTVGFLTDNRNPWGRGPGS